MLPVFAFFVTCPGDRRERQLVCSLGVGVGIVAAVGGELGQAGSVTTAVVAGSRGDA